MLKSKLILFCGFEKDLFGWQKTEHIFQRVIESMELDNFQHFPQDKRKRYALGYESDGVMLVLEALVPVENDEKPGEENATPASLHEETSEGKVTVHRKISSTLSKLSKLMESNLDAIDAGEEFGWYKSCSTKLEVAKGKETL